MGAAVVDGPPTAGAELFAFSTLQSTLGKAEGGGRVVPTVGSCCFDCGESAGVTQNQSEMTIP